MFSAARVAQPLTAAFARARIARVAANLAGLVKAVLNRREIYRLGEMSDAQLADIGLTRADLHVAWRVPIGSDPTACLGPMAEHRIRMSQEAARRIC